MGYNAGQFNVTGVRNTSIGNNAGKGVSANSHSDNTFVGASAGLSITTGDQNTSIGSLAGDAMTTLANTTSIGYQAESSATNKMRFGNASVDTITGTVDFAIDSDERLKTNIVSISTGLDFINALRPVRYQMKAHIEDVRNEEPKTYDGLIAQEVKTAMDDLDIDFSGYLPPVDGEDSEDHMRGLVYGKFVMPLINAVQELTARVADLESRLP